LFSSDVAMPFRVNALGLKALKFKQLADGFTVSTSNKMAGLEGRYALIQRVGEALAKHTDYFGKEVGRPGNIVDWLIRAVDPKTNRVSIKVLWKAVIEGYESIWPENLAGVRRGDVWVYSVLKKAGETASDMIPFHKLSQWLVYSLLEPLEQLGLKFDDMHLLTGLAEYRNGGLFVDTGVITPKDKHVLDMPFDVGSELVVEWRALTVLLLDELAKSMRSKLRMTEEQLPLARVLQGGTWTAGRNLATQKRPPNGPPPIQVRSDGSVF